MLRLMNWEKIRKLLLRLFWQMITFLFEVACTRVYRADRAFLKARAFGAELQAQAQAPTF